MPINAVGGQTAMVWYSTNISTATDYYSRYLYLNQPSKFLFDLLNLGKVISVGFVVQRG